MEPNPVQTLNDKLDRPKVDCDPSLGIVRPMKNVFVVDIAAAASAEQKKSHTTLPPVV